MIRTFLLAPTLAFALGAAALAQGSAASAPASSPAKKALVAKVLQLQQPGIEAMARQMAEQPAMLMMQQAGVALQQRVPADKREAVGKEIQADARKYADEAVPVIRERAVKLAPSTIGALLEERFTEAELKQIVALLESPVNRKFQALGPEMQRALGQKLVGETRDSIEPKVKALEQSIVRRLEAAAPAPASAPTAPAAPRQ